MTGSDFLNLLVRLVGEGDAKRCLAKFGAENLDRPFFGSVTTYEAVAMYVYSNISGWHQEINRELWSGKPSDTARAFADVIDTLLAKLPPLRGTSDTIYRGLKTNDLATFRQQHQIGQEVTFLGLTSAVYRRESTYGGNVLFTIRSQSARSVWHFAATFVEDEVLLPTGCRFKVVAVVDGIDQSNIVLEEVTHP